MVDAVESDQAYHDEVDGDDEVQQPRHDQDQDAGDKGDYSPVSRGPMRRSGHGHRRSRASARWRPDQRIRSPGQQSAVEKPGQNWVSQAAESQKLGLRLRASYKCYEWVDIALKSMGS